MMDERNEYEPELYTLEDEEGNEQTFEMLDAIEIDGIRYYAMIPYFENPEESLNDDGELVILKGDDLDENGMETLASIDDEEEFNRIGEIFLKRIEEMFGDELEEGCCDHGCDCGCCDHECE